MRLLVYAILLVHTSFLNKKVTSLDDDTDFFENQTVNNTNSIIVKTIVVDQFGIGNFKTVQQAVDSIPSNNKEWIKIRIRNGIYNEMVTILRDKQKIYMEGENPLKTIIQFNLAGDSINDGTFKLFADYFLGVNITFKNTYNNASSRINEMKVAPAALIMGDKAAFFQCIFISLQDTLSDGLGRHYFEKCYIEGAVDFIWGAGQSIYNKCVIHVSGQLKELAGDITAQGRNTEDNTSGFVFQQCTIVGSGKAYLGRAYRRYSRVLFSRTYMSNVVVPQGWDAWKYKGQEDHISYTELNCIGKGANQEGRVKWGNKLSRKQIKFLNNRDTFINQDGWMANIPKVL
ncbi:putative pectinesterase 10 [Cardamine amara subsp. amara]|uniref:pectinesterase n=1 Tax=Cardamine amara subsp. amara TaxID=228776 RepID=A0ABD0ZM87_CARAN